MTTKVRERPIIMGAESVNAIIEGRKTRTRRVVKLPPCEFPYRCYGKVGDVFMFGEDEYPEDGTFPVHCPYGQPGDRLWVRETWWCDPEIIYEQEPDTVAYRATAGDFPAHLAGERWRSPIHMPRWASRLTLEIADVRVERVQDISEADALAEGCPREMGWQAEPTLWFASAWDELNAKRGYGWDANPWVFVISFRRM